MKFGFDCCEVMTRSVSGDNGEMMRESGSFVLKCLCGKIESVVLSE